MKRLLLNIGFGNVVASHRVVAIVTPGSAPVKRLKDYAKKTGKLVIAIDLNPLSRTAQTADVTIVDNVVRAVPNILAAVKELKKLDRSELNGIVGRFDNQRNLAETLLFLRDRLTALAKGD